MQIELAKKQKYLYLQEVGPRWELEFTEKMYQPKYFMNNMDFVVTDDSPDLHEVLASNAFPSYFFGAAGSQSPLHTDGVSQMSSARDTWRCRTIAWKFLHLGATIACSIRRVL